MMLRRWLLAVAMVVGLIPVGSTAMASEPFCGVVLGMSQISETYAGSGLAPDGWMLHKRGSTTLGAWADPNGYPWTDYDLSNECVDPTVASFGFDPLTGGAPFASSLNAAVANIRTHYPTVGTVYVWLLVGGYDNGSCLNSRGREISATRKHRDWSDDLAAYALPVGVQFGPDVEIACPGYRDSLGHLNDAGKAEAGAQLAAFHN